MSDIQSLRDFVILCRLRSFTKAAELCHVSTSGLSRRIQNLETWLGAPVIDRQRSQFELTAEGQLLLAAAQDAVAQLDSVRNAIRRRSEENANHIRIAAPHVMSSTFFTSWLSRLHTQFGQARFSVTSALAPECLRLMAQADADFAVLFVDALGGISEQLRLFDEWSAHETLPLGAERLLPVSAPGLSGEAMHSLRDGRASVSFLAYDDDCSLAWALSRKLSASGALPELVCHHGNSLAEGLCSMALAGMGVAWLPECLIREELALGKLVRAGDEVLDVELNVVLLRRAVQLGARAEALWERLQSGRQPADVDRQVGVLRRVA